MRTFIRRKQNFSSVERQRNARNILYIFLDAKTFPRPAKCHTATQTSLLSAATTAREISNPTSRLLSTHDKTESFKHAIPSNRLCITEGSSRQIANVLRNKPDHAILAFSSKVKMRSFACKESVGMRGLCYASRRRSNRGQ